jgi:formylglycine-generating enzyme
VLTNLLVAQSPYWFEHLAAPPASQRFYRVAALAAITPPASGMALIPAGWFTMGNCMNTNEGPSEELPPHTIYVSAFYMDKCEVTKALWDDVYNWALTNGYSFEYGAEGKASNHPAQRVTWHDAVKWCNARSEKERLAPCYHTNASLSQLTIYRSGQSDLATNWVSWVANGYRLPTEAEWEKAARGGADGHRFPWSDADTVTHSQANYRSTTNYSYDISPTRGYHPAFNDGVSPYTSPVGYFAPNGYGLYDMAGNVFEWCWDWYGTYSSSSQTDPRGPASGSSRVLRGGGWTHDAFSCRTACRGYGAPTGSYYGIGFRSVLPAGQ